MKYKSLILMSAFAVVFASCDQIEMSDSKPITNPQLPIFEASGVTVTADSDISSGSTLNLQTLLDDNVESIDVFSISMSDSNLPESGKVYGYFEVSSSEDFESSNTITFDNLQIEGETVALSLQDLLNAHEQLFGKAPYERTIYYRVPLFAEVDGGIYRLNSENYYYAQGSFNTIGLDPGFEIEETYYILGTKGWNALEDCVAFKHYNGSAYDDPNFYITVTVASNTYFKIVPQSAYEMLEGKTETPDEFWKALIGVETDGDTALEGDLVPFNTETQTEPGSIKLEAAGIYNITINMQDWTYTIEQGTEVPDSPGVASGIYLRGGMNEWGATPEYEFLTTEEVGVYVIPYVTIEPVEFKVADADWGSINLGGTGNAVVIGEEYPLTGDANIQLSSTFTGAIILTNNDGVYSILFKEYVATTQGVASGIYLRGGMNDWGTPADSEFVTGPVENVWYLADQSIAAGTEFKVADANWDKVNYGTNLSPFDMTEGNGVLGLVYNAGNISLTAAFNGTLLLVKVGDYYFLYFEDGAE